MQTNNIHPLDMKLRKVSDDEISKLSRAEGSLNDLLVLAEQAEQYKKGYAYAVNAIVWARKERERIIHQLQQAGAL